MAIDGNKIKALADTIKSLISNHASKTGSAQEKGHVQASSQVGRKDIAGGSAGTDNGIYARWDHQHVLSDAYATSDHNHDNVYLKEHQDISGKENISNKISSWSSTTNNTRYPTEKLVKDSLDTKSDTNHNHDNRYYTETEIIDIFDELNSTDLFTKANKKVAQTNDTICLTAKLYGEDIEEKTIQFYNGNTLLGSSITDIYGTATYDYTCTGSGKKKITTKYGSVVSTPYPVLDCIFMDYKSDGTKNTDYYKSHNATVTSSDGEITVYATATGMYISNQVITGDFEAIFQCKNVNGNGVRVGFADFNSSSFDKSARVLFTYSDYYYLKFRRVSGTWTVSRSINGETWTDYSTLDASSLTSEDCYFMVYVQIPSGSDERRLTYKNLKIYPI